MTAACYVVATGIGRLRIEQRDDALTGVRWVDSRAVSSPTATSPSSPSSPRARFRPEAAPLPEDDPIAPTELLRCAGDQLRAYADGRRRSFDLPLAPEGSPFERAVWQAMAAIPYGATRTYGALAADLRSSARAVGRACGANPLPIVIPCHRVVGANGRLTGFSGGDGIDTKRALLTLEATVATADRLPLFATAGAGSTA